KEGSIEVQEGDEVEAGDFLGLAGNSGRSDVPHLHYHLQTGKAYNEGEGLPVQIKSYSENGQKVTDTSPIRGYLVQPLH
ncbi:M23 family metallopeptidase, partial [Tamlana crocina]